MTQSRSQSNPSPTPRQILTALFPYLKAAAAYARQIQARIATRPDKEGKDNFFAAALSDADLSVQTMLEVALLGTFPNIRFYGEEYEQSYNTKYFRAIELGEQDDYLVTLDPIDGTQFYLDGHSNYQIILSVLNCDEFEAVISLFPALHTYCYAVRGEGAWQGSLDDDLQSCQPLKIEAVETNATIFLGWGMETLADQLTDRYQVIDIANAYSKEVQVPNSAGLLRGELAGAVSRGAQFIDGAALAFIAQEAGCIVTTHDGDPPPPLNACSDYWRPGLIVATSASIHQDLLAAVQGRRVSSPV
jgi:fructose-1,6-bisphosphatase/inositol monophosphatase family enzyme